MALTPSASTAGHAPVANSSEASCQPSSTGPRPVYDEYDEILADIARGPRRGVLTWLRLFLAGQTVPTQH
jgi:hypothetical protein